MRRASIIAIVVSAMVPSMVSGLSRKDLTFYARLAGTPEPAFARGNATPTITGTLKFVDDGKRHGMLTGGPKADLAFDTAGHMDLDACTVAMWVKPVGWSVDTTLRFFMRVGEDPNAGGPGEGNFIWLYKYFTYPVWLLVQQDYHQREVYLTGPGSGDSGGVYVFAWQAGRWDHIAASWHENEMRVYVNGNYCGTAQTETPRLLRKLGTHFYIGGPNQQNTADTVISDVFMFNRPLTGAEIKALSDKGQGAIDDKPTWPDLEAGCDFFPSMDRLRLRLSVVGRRPDAPGNLRAAVTVESRATGRPTQFSRIVTKLQRTRWQTELDTQALEVGAYRVLATLLDGAQVASQASIDFEKPKRPAWLGTKLGIPTRVPRPWTPIRHRADKLDCWGRTYQWANTLLPSQVHTQKQAVLSRPIGLVATVGGKTVRLGPASVRFKRTALKADVTATAPLGPLTVKADTWMEFDGFTWTKLTVTGPATAAVQRLVLEIPYRAEVGTLWHADLKPGNISGPVRRTHLAIRACPMSWIGNETGGLQWCAERVYHWPVRRKDHMVELEPGAKETVFRVTFIDGRRTMGKPFEVEFGLVATPVRPYVKGWRTLEPLNIWWPQWARQHKTHRSGAAGYPVPSPDGSWRRTLKVMTERGDGKGPFPYMCINTFWRGAPVYRTFRSEWVTSNAAPAPLDMTANEWSAAGVCEAARSFVDWRIWRFYKTFKEHPELAKSIRGMYLDVTSAPACGNIAHGCGLRTADGTLIKRYSLLGTREFQKRLYCLLQKHWPHMMIINHESNNWHMSQVAFAHIFADGESTWRNPPYTIDKLNYYDFVKLADWRSQHMGRQFGQVPLFLPQPARRVHGNKKLWAHVIGETGIPASQHVAGMLLVHDIIPWPAYMNPEPFVRLRKMKDAFGWDDQLRFTGYWTKHSLLKLESDVQPVVASIYRRPGKALIVVMNDSDKPAKVRLTLSPAKLGVKAITKLVDAYAAPSFEYKNSDIQAYLAGKGPNVFKMYKSPGRDITVPVGTGGATSTVEPRSFRALVAE